jgi:CO dehydrogenase maturation factor
MPAYPWVVLDNEAGLEHLNRRTAATIDALLVVVTANPLSHDTAKRVAETVNGLDRKIAKSYLLGSMIKPHHEERFQKLAADLGMPYAGAIPYDPQIEEAVFVHRTVQLLKGSAAQQSIEAVVAVVGG